jgi:regulator of RNase E activity RraA
MERQPVWNTEEMTQVRERYQRLYGGVVFDVLEHLGYPNQVVSHEIAPLGAGMKLAGPAFTVKGTTSTARDESLRYKRLEMINQMRGPCIEVRDGGTQFHVALYGELSATTAAAHGAVGALVDGGVRDTAMLVDMGFPVFARYRTPIEAFGRWQMIDYMVPVLVKGELTDSLQVNPGDFIFGDYDGVLVVPCELTMEVLVECERVIGIENVARAEFARGDDPVEVFSRHKRL